MSEGTRQPLDHFLFGFLIALALSVLCPVLIMQARSIQSPGKDDWFDMWMLLFFGAAQAMWLVPLLGYCLWKGLRRTAAGVLAFGLLALILNLGCHAWVQYAPSH